MIGFDTSALIKRYRKEGHSIWIRELMSGDPDWFGSTLIAAETAIVMARVPQTGEELGMTDARISRDLEFFNMVPIDAECITAAIQLGRAFKLRTLDAIHLAAFRTMPSKCRFVVFDARLAEASRAMGLTLLTPD